MNEKLFIISGNYKEHKEYITTHNLNPHNCINVYDSCVLRGRRVKYYVFYGSYNLRPDISKVMEILYMSLYDDAVDLTISEINVIKEEKNVINVGKNFHNLWESVFDFLQN